jgi:hypothetical protein
VLVSFAAIIVKYDEIALGLLYSMATLMVLQ